MDADPARYAAEWADAWNRRDIEAVLGHFDDDAVFTSPLAERLMPESGGRLVGKDAIRAYWQAGIAAIPDLHFTVDQVFAGVDFLVIQYRNQKGVPVSELLRTREGVVVEGHGTYPPEIANPTGAR